MKKRVMSYFGAVVLAFIMLSCGGGGGGSGGASTSSSSSNVSNGTTTVTSAFIGAKAPTESKEVGDIVFSDGSATPYTSDLVLTANQKSKAVAVIIYKGTECSDDGSIRTLGVGLKRSAFEVDWINRDRAHLLLADLDTVRESIKNGSQNLSKITGWYTNHSWPENTVTAVSFPALYCAKDYGIENGTYTDGWYLPSKVELQQVYEQRMIIDETCSLCELTKNFSSTSITGGYFLTSTSVSFAKMYILDFVNGIWLQYGTAMGYVCAIREF